MIHGITAMNGIVRQSLPIFKGVATLTGGIVEVFSYEGTVAPQLVFDVIGIDAVSVELQQSHLLVMCGGRTGTYPRLRVYTWDGTTFNETWVEDPYGPVESRWSASMSFDGSRIVTPAYSNGRQYPTGEGFVSYVRNGNDFVVEEFQRARTLYSTHIPEDGDVAFFRSTNNTPLWMSERSGTSWSTLAGYGTNIATSYMPISGSQMGSSIYVATTLLSSPYLNVYRRTSTGTMSKLGNISPTIPSTWRDNMSIDMSFDGTLLAFGYKAGTTQNGGIRIYKRVSDTSFNATELDTGAIIEGAVGGVSFSSDGNLLFVANTYQRKTSDRCQVYSRSSKGVWSLIENISTYQPFKVLTSTEQCLNQISAN